jgi:hypothetical protein
LFIMLVAMKPGEIAVMKVSTKAFGRAFRHARKAAHSALTPERLSSYRTSPIACGSA